MSRLFQGVVFSFLTVPTHTADWFACFGVKIHSACVDLMIDKPVNKKPSVGASSFVSFSFVSLRSYALSLPSFGFSFFLFSLDDVSSWSLLSVSPYSLSPETMYFILLRSILFVFIIIFRRFKDFFHLSFDFCFRAKTTREHDKFSTERFVSSMITIFSYVFVTMYVVSTTGSSL